MLKFALTGTTMGRSDCLNWWLISDRVKNQTKTDIYVRGETLRELERWQVFRFLYQLSVPHFDRYTNVDFIRPAFSCLGEKSDRLSVALVVGGFYQ